MGRWRNLHVCLVPGPPLIKITRGVSWAPREEHDDRASTTKRKQQLRRRNSL